MYSFLRDGEFVQLTLEDGKASGFISRFGDTDSDKDQFIDQFFDQASLAADRLSFKTKTVHGVWYEFTGVITITPGKRPGGRLPRDQGNAGAACKRCRQSRQSQPAASGTQIVSAGSEQAVRQPSAVSDQL
jgi:hypothetical protein